MGSLACSPPGTALAIHPLAANARCRSQSWNVPLSCIAARCAAPKCSSSTARTSSAKATTAGLVENSITLLSRRGGS